MLPPRGKEGNSSFRPEPLDTHLIKTFIEHFLSAEHYAQSFAHFIIVDSHDIPMRWNCHISPIVQMRNTGLRELK